MSARWEPVTIADWEKVIKIDLEPEQWRLVEADWPSVLPRIVRIDA